MPIHPEINLNDTVPAAPAGKTNVIFQIDDPNAVIPNVSAYYDPPLPPGSSTLAGDSDVSITSPTNAQLLIYDSGASKWKNHTLVAGDIPNLAESQITNLVTDLAAKAPLASPALTGTPTAPTASPHTSDTQIATTKYVDDAVTAGGGGGVPTGSNIVVLQPLIGDTDTLSGYTNFQKLPGRVLVNLGSSWKFSIWVSSGTFTADHTVVLRTAIDSLTVIDSTTVLWSGNASCSVSAGEQFCDSISLGLDTAHDYYIAIHGTSGAPYKIVTIPTGSPLVGSGYALGDQTGVTTIPSISNELMLSRVITA